MYNLKLKNRYFLYSYNPKTSEVDQLFSFNSDSEAKDKLKEIKTDKSNEFILLKITENPTYKESDIGLNKMNAGPYKILFKMYEYNDKDEIVPKYEKIKNKKGELDSDKRNSQFVFITKDYLDKLSHKDLNILVKLAGSYKLEKRPLAPKLINQIEKYK